MYKKEYVQTFLEKQGQLFDEPVADDFEEAEAFLEDCMAQPYPPAARAPHPQNK